MVLHNWENTRIAVAITVFDKDGEPIDIGDEGLETNILQGVTLWNARTTHIRKKLSTIYTHNNSYAEIGTDYRFRIITPVTFKDVELLREIASHKLYFTISVKPRGVSGSDFATTEFKLKGEIYGGCKIDREEYSIEVDDGPPLAVFEGQALRKDRIKADGAPFGALGETSLSDVTNMAFGSGLPKGNPFEGTGWT